MKSISNQDDYEKRTLQLSDSVIDQGEHYVTPITAYMRFRISNESVSTATIIVHMVLYRYPHTPMTASEPLTQYSSFLNTRSLLTGLDEYDNYKTLQTTFEGNIKTDSTFTSFGDLITTELTTIFSGNFLYNNINSQKFSLLGTGTQTFQDALMSLNIPTTIYSYMVLRSKEIVQYQPGTVNICRFSAVFNTGVANSVQRIGLGNANNDIGFGYNGVNFGIIRSYGGKIHTVNVTISSAATSGGNLTITLNSVVFSIAVTNASGDIAFTAFQIANGTYANWIARNIGNIVEFTYSSGVGARSGTYSITPSLGVTSTAFTTLTTGAALTEVWVLESEFENPITFNKQLGNIYEIEFSWLGYNNMKFKVFSPAYSQFVTVHTLRFPNTQVYPTLYMPHMLFQMAINSAGSTTAMSLSCASMSTFTPGTIKRITVPNFTFSHSKSISANTETVIFALRVKYQINGIIVNSKILIDDLTFACDGTKSTRLSIYKNPTTLSLNTTASYNQWVDLGSDSMVLTNILPATFTGGTLVHQFYISKSSNFSKDFQQNDFTLYRDDILLVTAFSTGASDVSAALGWIGSH